MSKRFGLGEDDIIFCASAEQSVLHDDSEEWLSLVSSDVRVGVGEGTSEGIELSVECRLTFWSVPLWFIPEALSV